MEYTTTSNEVRIHVVQPVSRGKHMSRDIVAEISKLNLRVLEEFDPDHGAFVARCLETGAIASGETVAEAHALIREVLESDILLAVEANTLVGLFHVRAAPEVWDRWYTAVSTQTVQTEQLDIRLPVLATGQDALPRRAAQSALSIVQSKDQHVA
jgi:hypothetical protein